MNLLSNNFFNNVHFPDQIIELMKNIKHTHRRKKKLCFLPEQNEDKMKMMKKIKYLKYFENKNSLIISKIKMKKK